MHPPHARLPWLLLCLVTLALAPLAPARPARAAGWSEPLILSDPAMSAVAATPELVVDGAGGVHVLWQSVLARPAEQGGGLADALIYRVRAGGVWSAPEPIYRQDRPLYADTSSPLSSDAAVRNAAFALRGAMASAPDGKVHIAFGDQLTQRYLGLPWGEVARMSALLPPVIIGPGTYSALAAGDDGALHAALAAIPRGAEEAGAAGGTCADCAEVIYRRSGSGGVTWTRPENLSRLEGQDLNPQLRAAEQGRVHLLWDHMGAALESELPYPLYRRSDDGGQSWAEPVTLGAPGEGSLQAALGVAPGGRLLTVYGGASTGSVYFQSSADGGLTWSPPGLVPGVVSPGMSATGDGRFSLAADGGGRLHLLMVGAQPADGDGGLRLLHLSWDGEGWSPPAPVPSGGATPASPRLAVERGNLLHAVWSTAESDADGARRDLIWHSSAPAEAPELAPPPTFTPVAVAAPTVAPSATPAPTATPLAAASLQQEVAQGPPRWEGESLPILFMACGLVLLMLGGVMWWATRRRRDDL